MPRYSIAKGRIVVNEADTIYPIEYSSIFFHEGHEVFVYPNDQSNPQLLKIMVGLIANGPHKVKSAREVTYQGLKGIYMTSNDFDAWETNGGNRLKQTDSKTSKSTPPYDFHIDYSDKSKHLHHYGF